MLPNFRGGSSYLTFAKVHSTKLSHHKTLKKFDSDAIVNFLSRKQNVLTLIQLHIIFKFKAKSLLSIWFVTLLHLLPLTHGSLQKS